MYVGLGSKGKVLDAFETPKRKSTLWKAGTHSDPRHSGPEETKEAPTETRPSGFDREGDLQPQANTGHCSFKRMPRITEEKSDQDLCCSKTRLTGVIFPQVSMKKLISLSLKVSAMSDFL